jgi:ABC-type Zn2+ transport system substrate-binding protein/surface adhesin
MIKGKTKIHWSQSDNRQLDITAHKKLVPRIHKLLSFFALVVFHDCAGVVDDYDYRDHAHVHDRDHAHAHVHDRDHVHHGLHGDHPYVFLLPYSFPTPFFSDRLHTSLSQLTAYHRKPRMGHFWPYLGFDGEYLPIQAISLL